jgi:hypothetical protein
MWFVVVSCLCACSVPKSSILYPTLQAQQIDFLCQVVYEPEHQRGAAWKDSAPEVLIVSPDRVTVYFKNGQTQTMGRTPEIVVGPGTYACP